jgi:hypothetical protein
VNGGEAAVTVTDTEMQDLLARSRTYTLMILREGPAIGSADAGALIWEHGRRNLALRREGRMPIICAVDDDTDMCGIGVFDLDLEQTRQVMDGDPGVRAGVFTYELHTTRSFPGSVLPE